MQNNLWDNQKKLVENEKYKARDFILEYKYKRFNTKEITTMNRICLSHCKLIKAMMEQNPYGKI